MTVLALRIDAIDSASTGAINLDHADAMWALSRYGCCNERCHDPPTHAQLITGVEKQIGHVRDALRGLDGDTEIDIAGALCFPNVDGLPWVRRVEIRGILVDGPNPVARLAVQANSSERPSGESGGATLLKPFLPREQLNAGGDPSKPAPPGRPFVAIAVA